MKIIKITVNQYSDGLKIDKAIMEAGVDLSRKEVRRILDNGGIHCNGKKVFVASYTVKNGDHITLAVHPDLSSKKEEHSPIKDEDILYWKHGVLAVNKAPGIASVPTVSAQTAHVKKLLEPWFKNKEVKIEDLTACHRLDKETSGILLFALGRAKSHWIMEQFKNHTIKKVYHALCYGIPKEKKWEVQCFLSPMDKRTGRVNIVRSGGYPSFSSFQVIAVSKQHNLSLVRVTPKTGRSHQIRVHLQHSQLPLIGDKKYTLPNIKNLHPSLAELSFQHHFLHASMIEFIPEQGQKRLVLKAEFPPLFHSFIKKSQMEFLVKDEMFF